MTCGQCGHQVPEGLRFCPACGARLAAACSSCGAELFPPYRFCGACGTAQGEATPPHPPAPAPEAGTARRRASVLFADLVGFTTLSEARDTEDVRDLLSRYFEDCRAVIGRYGGQVEKFIGDAVMAVWGADVSHEDDAERAVRAGLELVATVAGFADDVHAPGLALRVGIVSDQVAVNVGAVAQGGQGMVAGDPVNTAARIQSAAAPGRVWVDEATKNLSSAAIAYADTGLHALKGKAEPVRLWEATAVVAAVGGAQRADGLEAPLVGRARELRVLKELFHSCEEGRSPVLVVVAGEAGVGKTRLVWEFEKYVDGLTRTTRWHSGRCLSYGEGVSFYALAEAVRGRLLTLVEADEPQPSETTLVDRALERWVPPDERDWLRDRLAALLGLGASGMTKEDLFIAWAAFFRHVGAGDPVTLLVDDAQHADDGLLAFVEFLLTTADFPVFVALMTRPELLSRATGLVTHPRTHLVNLPSLSEGDVALLVDGLVPGLPTRLHDQLVERAEGIPLYAVETVRALVDRDVVVPREGVYALADAAGATDLDLETLDVPASLHALVAARLDRLSPEQRTVVHHAAVLGQSFTPDALLALGLDAGLDEPTVQDALAVLVRTQLLSRETSRLSSEQGSYKFAQAIVRQVAYGTLARRDRKRLHLAAVSHLESSGLSGDDTAAVRAQHHLDALAASGPADADADRLRTTATQLLVTAADRALALGAPTEALRHLASALEVSRDAEDEVVADLHLRAAKAAHVADDVDALEHHGDRAAELFDSLGDLGGSAQAAARRTVLQMFHHGDLRTAAALGEEWWARLEGVPDSPRVLDARLDLSFAVAADLTARRALWEALSWRLVHCERTSNRAEQARTYLRMAFVSSRLGAGGHARSLLQTAVEHARAANDPRAMAWLMSNLAGMDNTQDLDSAAALARDAAEHARRTGDPAHLRFALTNLAIACWARGEWSEMPEGAFEELDTALAALRGAATGEESARTPEVREEYLLARHVWAAFGLAVLHGSRGDVARCLSEGRAAVEVHLDQHGVEDDFVHFFAHLARVAWRVGDDDMLAWLTAQVDEAGDAIPLGLRAHRHHVAGLVADRDGDTEAARAAYSEAIELFRRWGAVPAEARAHADLGVLLTRLGRSEEAAPHLAQAQEVFERLGAAAWQAELDEALTGAGVGVR